MTPATTFEPDAAAPFAAPALTRAPALAARSGLMAAAAASALLHAALVAAAASAPFNAAVDSNEATIEVEIVSAPAEPIAMTADMPATMEPPKPPADLAPPSEVAARQSSIEKKGAPAQEPLPPIPDAALAPAQDAALAPAQDPAIALAQDPAIALAQDPALAPAQDAALAPAQDAALAPAQDAALASAPDAAHALAQESASAPSGASPPRDDSNSEPLKTDSDRSTREAFPARSVDALADQSPRAGAAAPVIAPKPPADFFRPAVHAGRRSPSAGRREAKREDPASSPRSLPTGSAATQAPRARRPAASPRERRDAGDAEPARPGAVGTPSVGERPVSGAQIAAFRLDVARRVAQLKRYPSGARQRGEIGAPKVTFALAPSGALASVSLTRSSGHGELDAEALSMVRRAAPFPKPPVGAPRSFSISVSFDLR
jgi:TonB family protein